MTDARLSVQTMWSLHRHRHGNTRTTLTQRLITQGSRLDTTSKKQDMAMNQPPYRL